MSVRLVLSIVSSVAIGVLLESVHVNLLVGYIVFLLNRTINGYLDLLKQRERALAIAKTIAELNMTELSPGVYIGKNDEPKDSGRATVQDLFPTKKEDDDKLQ